MPNLKDLRVRIKSVRSTQKITSAMKMVAGAKLRKAQERVEATRPYTQKLRHMVQNCLADPIPDHEAPILYRGNPEVPVHLLIVMTSDRGLCGGFNGNIIRQVKQLITQYTQEGQQVKLFCIGRRGRDVLKRDYQDLIIDSMTDVGKKNPSFNDATAICEKIVHLLTTGQVGKISCIYSTFKSALTQKITQDALVPLMSSQGHENTQVLYEFEPSRHDLLEQLLPYNLATQVYQILLETNASEHGARMTAMDNATRNAQDVIKRLELNYNRTRQAYITKELIEIISGAEAL